MTGSFTVDAMPGASVPSIVLPRAEADTNGWEAGKWHSLSGPLSETGVNVTPATALSHGPVWQGVNLLAGDVGQLPWHKMVRRGRNRGKDREHQLEVVLTKRPNPYQTPSIWKETMMAWALLWGNGISYVHRVAGNVDSLWPLQPDRTGYVKEDGQYWIWSWVEGETWWFHPDDLFHIRGLTNNGFWGESFVKVCRDVLGHGLALRMHGNSTFRNGARPSLAVRHPKVLSKDARDQFRKEWMEKHSGPDKAGLPVMLWEGMEIEPYSTSNIDAQWLDAVKLDPVQVAGLLQIPPHMLGALENSAVRANLEDQTRGYFQRSLGRHLNKFNEEAERTLLTERERYSVDPDHYFRWFTEAFLRGDTKTRYTAYQIGIQSRILCPNEAREAEDLDPYEGGDEFLNPNIDKAGGGGSGFKDPETDEEREEAVRNLVRAQCESLIDFECHKLAWAAKKPKNFVAWLDGFYDETFVTAGQQRLEGVGTLAAIMQLGGAWESAVRLHASASKADVLAIAGESLAAELPEALATLTASFKARAESLTRRILGDDDDAG